jgi:AraC-like DNA-binding protein
MTAIKRYEKVNAQHDEVSFGISRMEDIYTDRQGAADEPHRHDYYTVLIVKEAKGEHKIDFCAYPLEERQVFFVAPGQVHQVIEEKRSRGFALTFSTQFLVESNIPLTFIESLNLFRNYGESPPLLPSKDQFDRIAHFANESFALFRSDAKLKIHSIGAYVKLLLIECNNICSIDPVETYAPMGGSLIVREFKLLVGKHFRAEHSVSYYADALHITPDHLNRTIKAKIGKTAKEYIQSRIVTEAKRLLCFSGLSNKEVGHELGFNEPANFSAFFKKYAGQSPTAFKTLEKPV